MPSLVSPLPALSARVYTTALQDGVWWLLDPDRNRVVSMGVNVIRPNDWSPHEDSPKYRGAELAGGEEPWVRRTAARLRDWGFNTVGAWSARSLERQGLPYVVCLHLAQGQPHRLIDVWDPAYALAVDAAAEDQMKGRDPLDPNLIGWFLDNELPWYGEAGWPTADPRTLLDRYLELPETSPGRRRAEEFLAWRAPRDDRRKAADRFAGEVAAQFLTLAVTSLRKRDPHHLNLGIRIAGDAPDPVIEATGRACDVFSVNWYVKHGRPDPAHLDRLSLLAGAKPILITEFSYRAMENRSGTRNTKGADVTVLTQEDRAKRYTRYVETLAKLPQVVGFHWFQWFDQPAKGRFDGEDSNYGIVDHADEPYEPLLAAMRRMNAAVAELHANSGWKLPAKIGDPRPRPRARLAGVDAPPATGRFTPRLYADYARSGPRGETWGDPDAGCDARLVESRNRAVFSFSATGGWGCGVNLSPPSGIPFDAAGARRLIVEAAAPAGLRWRILLVEDGAGPPGAGDFRGLRGSDGEQWESPELAGTGRAERLVLDLVTFVPSSGWGNPSGNEVLDTQAIRTLALYVPGGQPGGTVAVRRIRFE